MKTKEIIALLQQYNPESDFNVVLNSKNYDFNIRFGYSVDCTEEDCEDVSLFLKD